MAGTFAGTLAQASLFDLPDEKDALGLTFRDSKALPVHGWFPYVEGFSAQYIEGLVRSHAGHGIVFDPFGGSGTVNLIASSLGYESAFSEANPFMRFVAETKITARHVARSNWAPFKKALDRFARWMSTAEFDAAAKRQDLGPYRAAFNDRDFFAENDLRELLAVREGAHFFGGGNQAFRDLFMLALASVTVACSNMTRRADLRRRRPDEYLTRVVNVRAAVSKKLADMSRDIFAESTTFAPARFATADARVLCPELVGKVSLILTSPPYLNGTNYIRNTKLELWLTGFIGAERELAALNKVCMVCGINNVVKGRPPQYNFSGVEIVASRLDRVSTDLRIPALVRGYFSDMFSLLRNCASYLQPGASLILDIGDSKFYGVHVPTDDLLVEVAQQAGLRLIETRLLARRHSRDKTPLKQVELTFSNAN
ncbi:MAG: restriction endonuclease [Opitutaceae bacterium]